MLARNTFRFVRCFGVLEDMEAKLRAQFNPSVLKVEDKNGDLYKIEVSAMVNESMIVVYRFGPVQGNDAPIET